MSFVRLATLTVTLTAATCATAFAADQPLLFETDIQPLLAKKCGRCHSDKVHKGGLDLSSMSGLRRGGESGESALAESVDESLLWIMIEGGDMPPEGQPALNDKELKLIRRWLETGAASRQPVQTPVESLTQHDVQPIFLLRCKTCHGPRLQQGGVDLSSIATLKQGGKNGPLVVPGDPDGSLLIQRIESEACPPRDQLLRFFVRRPPESEVETLRSWIAAGCPEADVPPDVATTDPDPLVTEEDRLHWAFQPPRGDPSTGSVDAFIAQKLRHVELSLSPVADRGTLIRRAYLDLTGMPPTLEQLHRWQQAADASWYALMIDELLDSPHYGERWGRYWLDLAGYADSEGGVSADPVRKVAWKYRDYVIRSFNADKPYDRFLVEQLAGDELVDVDKAEHITPEMVDNLIATGFLRMSIDQTGSRTMNFVPERLGVINDALTIVGSGLMGLTMECARCHSHKYDPIPQRDYYRLKAVFQGALDEHDWLTFKNRNLTFDTVERLQKISQVNPPLARQLKTLQAELREANRQLLLTTLKEHYPTQSQADRDETLRALGIADNNRTLPQRNLVEMLQRAQVVPESRQPAAVQSALQAVRDLEVAIIELERQQEPPATIRALWDRGEPSPTYLLRRGEHDKPGQLIGPGVPSVLTDGRTPFQPTPPFPDGTPKTGRRLAFARWLTDPQHPLTARVLVNRVWYHHFGTGLVSTLENFGTRGEKPSHPELLDWLALKFIDQGWSIKQLHRVIMNSKTYRQSSVVTEDRLKRDPQNRLLSRMPLRRMDAETLRDSLLAVSGRLSDDAGGPPDPISVDQHGLVSIRPLADGTWRRSVYAQFRRTEIPTMLATFDYPVMGPNCQMRPISNVSPQPLMLMNNDRVRELAASLARRVEQHLAAEPVADATAATPSDADSTATASLPEGPDTELKQPAAAASNWDACVRLVYQLALSRLPNQQEHQLGVETLTELSSQWNNNPRAVLDVYCHTILNSAAFLYID